MENVPRSLVYDLVKTAQIGAERGPGGGRWSSPALREMVLAMTVVPEVVWDRKMSGLGFPTWRCVKRIEVSKGRQALMKSIATRKNGSSTISEW